MLHHDASGEGSLVVLLHSGGMSSRQWRRLVVRLSPAHRVVAPDFLGSGENPPWPPNEPFAHGLDVAAVAELIESLGAPAHVVGHSYGGFIALALARESPALVRSLAVYDPVAFGVLHEPRDVEGFEDLARAAKDPIFTDDARGGGEEWLEAFVDYWNGAGAWRLLPGSTRSAFLRTGRKVFLEVRSLLADRTPAEAYRGLALPTLLVGGERSPVAARRVVSRLAAALPNARAVSVEGAGHMGPILRADDFNRLVAEHVANAEHPV